MSGNDTNGEWWHGWQSDDLVVEVALDARGAASELSRLRAENESLKAERLRQDGESFLYLKGEVERLRELLDPDNEDAVERVQGSVWRYGTYLNRAQVRDVLAALRKEADQ